MTLPAAVLWDCDGTLLDSETVVLEAMGEALATLGHELTDDLVAGMVGSTWPTTRALMVDAFGLDEADLEAYRAVFRARVVPRLEDPALVHDDVLETLEHLRRADVPMAVVTSSGREHLTRVLGRPPLAGRFAVRIAREDVEQHKPSPVPYRTALRGLAHVTGRALPVDRVAVVEDSATGVAAGLAAGCWTVAVDRGAGLHDLTAADVVVDRVTPEVLVRRSGAPQARASGSGA